MMETISSSNHECHPVETKSGDSASKKVSPRRRLSVRANPTGLVSSVFVRTHQAADSPGIDMRAGRHATYETRLLFSQRGMIYALPSPLLRLEPRSPVVAAPGNAFWLGFMIDDKPGPGSDIQNLMVWPATYGTFNPMDDGALAVFSR